MTEGRQLTNGAQVRLPAPAGLTHTVNAHEWLGLCARHPWGLVVQ